MKILYEVRQNDQGVYTLFDIDDKTRERMRRQHPIWIARFLAKDQDHAKSIFEVLTGERK